MSLMVEPGAAVSELTTGGGCCACTGVDDGCGVARDRDMAFPEQEIAAPQIVPFASVERAAERGLLHVAIAQGGDAGGMKR